jgi:hypothetical protein
MSNILDRGDSPVFFNKDGSLCTEKDLIFYRGKDGEMIFKSDQPKDEKDEKTDPTTKNPKTK